MANHLMKLNNLKKLINQTFSDIEKDYPINAPNDNNEHISSSYQRLIIGYGENIISFIRKLPESKFSEFLKRQLNDSQVFSCLMSDEKRPINEQPAFALTPNDLKEIKPIFKDIIQQLLEHYSDNLIELRSSADIAFEHLQKSIIVNKVQQEEWQEVWKDKNLETHFEKLGETHLLSHKIWTAKFNVEGARTDLVLTDPVTDDRIDPNDYKYQSGKGLLLTEWKVCKEPAKSLKLIDDAIQQATKYLSPHLGGFEFAKLCYIIVVSNDYIDKGETTRTINGVAFRVVNIACNPSSPSKLPKKS